MLRLIPLLALPYALLLCTPAQAQEHAADRQIDQAVRLMDNELYDESEALLRAVLADDADNYRACYELGCLLYTKQNYTDAAKTLERAIRLPDVSDQGFQLLGNAYDCGGNARKAIATYKKGLKRFPRSGALHLELGNMAAGKNDYARALEHYEQGIAVAPMFPSNYRSAAIVLMNSSEPVWGMLYGELFMNLERTTARNSQMSEQLYAAFRNAITIDGEGKVELRFTSNPMVRIQGMELIMTFPLAFELMTVESVPPGAQHVDAALLDTMRRNFIARFSAPGEEAWATRYGNVLLDYQRRIADAGHLEAYNRWIFSEGDPAAFVAWHETHAEEWNAFVAWFNDNPLKIGDGDRRRRDQYE